MHCIATPLAAIRAASRDRNGQGSVTVLFAPDLQILIHINHITGWVRQIIKISELYLELPARRLLPALLGKTPASDDLKTEVRTVLDRGSRSLNALASFSPYVAGEQLTLADIYLRYALSIPRMVGPSQLDWDVRDDVDGLGDWLQLMADSDISRKVDADLEANTEEFMAYVASNSK